MNISDVLTEAIDESSGPSVTVEELLQSFHSRSYGAALFILALLALFPFIGGIPGAPLIIGLLIILFAVQLAFLKPIPWLPRKLARLSIRRQRVQKIAKQARPWLQKFERFIRARLLFLSQPPFLNLVALTCLLLALTFIPLSFIPFGIALPAAAILLFSIGLLARDGFVLLLGFTFTGLNIWFITAVWPW